MSNNNSTVKINLTPRIYPIAATVIESPFELVAPAPRYVPARVPTIYGARSEAYTRLRDLRSRLAEAERIIREETAKADCLDSEIEFWEDVLSSAESRMV